MWGWEAGTHKCKIPAPCAPNYYTHAHQFYSTNFVPTTIQLASGLSPILFIPTPILTSLQYPRISSITVCYLTYSSNTDLLQTLSHQPAVAHVHTHSVVPMPCMPRARVVGCWCDGLAWAGGEGGMPSPGWVADCLTPAGNTLRPTLTFCEESEHVSSVPCSMLPMFQEIPACLNSFGCIMHSI